MKRTRIKPKPHPQNPRSTFAPRTKRMNRVNPNRRAANAATLPERKRFVASVWLCQCCGKRRARSCHEMAAGGSRGKALHSPSCWLALCESDPATGVVGCHPIVQGWPRDCSLVQQLALKKYSDPERYDRAEVLRVKGWAESAVTEPEVDWFVEYLKSNGVEAWLTTHGGTN